MLKQMWMSVVFLCVVGAVFPASALGQTGNPATIRATNFAVIGITRGQTLQINVVAYPPGPCFGRLAPSVG